jgi:hypothetical protein
MTFGFPFAVIYEPVNKYYYSEITFDRFNKFKFDCVTFS